MVGEVWNFQVLVNMPVTLVSRCRPTSSNANISVLRHPQFPDMAAGIGPPDGANVIHRWKNDLLIQYSFVSDGKATPCLGEDIILPVFGQLFF